MKFLFVFVLVLAAVANGSEFASAAPKKIEPLSFQNVSYLHRYSKDNLHEFTPKGQDNLKKWTDMVTINFYPDAKEGDGLAAQANAVLENYKANKGRVLKTSSVPRTEKKPAEHLIAVAFGRADFIEVAFARFKMYNGVGISVVYSHRVYGKDAGRPASEWLKKKGATVEAALMKWDGMPKGLRRPNGG